MTAPSYRQLQTVVQCLGDQLGGCPSGHAGRARVWGGDLPAGVGPTCGARGTEGRELRAASPAELGRPLRVSGQSTLHFIGGSQSAFVSQPNLGSSFRGYFICRSTSELSASNLKISLWAKQPCPSCSLAWLSMWPNAHS